MGLDKKYLVSSYSFGRHWHRGRTVLGWNSLPIDHFRNVATPRGRWRTLRRRLCRILVATIIVFRCTLMGIYSGLQSLWWTCPVGVVSISTELL